MLFHPGSVSIHDALDIQSPKAICMSKKRIELNPTVMVQWSNIGGINMANCQDVSFY